MTSTDKARPAAAIAAPGRFRRALLIGLLIGALVLGVGAILQTIAPAGDDTKHEIYLLEPLTA